VSCCSIAELLGKKEQQKKTHSKTKSAEAFADTGWAEGDLAHPKALLPVIGKLQS